MTSPKPPRSSASKAAKKAPATKKAAAKKKAPAAEAPASDTVVDEAQAVEAAPVKKKRKGRAAPVEVRFDGLGDPLPKGAIARLGTARLRVHARSLDWSDDGRRLATGRRGQVQVWETERGGLVADLLCPGREKDDATRVRLGPGGAQVAAILKGQLRVFDVETGTERQPRPPGAFRDVVFSPSTGPRGQPRSGAWLVASSTDTPPALVVFDLATLEVARRVETPGAPAALCFSPGSALLVSIVLGEELVVLEVDVATGRETRRLAARGPEAAHGPGERPTALACDGASVTAVVGRRLVRWSLVDGGVTLERPFAPDPPAGAERPWQHDVVSCALSRDGRRLASRVREQQVARVVEVDTGVLVRELSVGYDALAFTGDGARLAYGASSNRTALVDVDTGVERPAFEGHAEGVDRIWFSPDGRALRSTGTRDTRNVVVEWDVAARRAASTRGFAAQPMDLAPDGRTALFYVWPEDRRPERTREDSRVVHARLPAGDGPFEPIATKVGGGGRSRFAGDGEHALTLREGTSVELWSLRTGEVARTFDAGGRYQTYAAVISPDGRTLATGGWEGVVHLWDLATGAHRARLAAHRHGIMTLVFSPDGALLASGAQDRTATLISIGVGQSTATGHAVRSLKHRKEVFGLGFSPDGRLLATGDEAAVRVWDVASATEVWKVPQGSREVVFAPDGALLAVGTWGPILLFERAAWSGA